MDRREFLKRSAVASAGLAVFNGLELLDRTTALAAPRLSRAGTLSGGHVLWGVNADPRGSEDWMSAVTDLEAAVGRTFAVYRKYHVWDEPLPSKFETWATTGGRTPYIDWKAWLTNGSRIPWATIARGDYDSWINTQAQSINAFGRPMYICFHHEPEDDPLCGSAADYRAAYDHVRNIFDANGVTNLTWVMALMAYTFKKGNGGPANWEPSRYEVVGVDGYNRYPAKPGVPYKSFTGVFSPARAFAQLRGKPLAIAEWGCVEQPDPNGKANWIADGGNVMKSWPEVIWASYSHTLANGLAFWVDTSAASLAAFRSVGLDPYFA